MHVLISEARVCLFVLISDSFRSSCYTDVANFEVFLSPRIQVVVYHKEHFSGIDVVAVYFGIFNCNRIPECYSKIFNE